MSVHVCGWPPLPHPAHRQKSPFLLRPRPKRSSRPCRAIARQRPPPRQPLNRLTRHRHPIHRPKPRYPLVELRPHHSTRQSSPLESAPTQPPVNALILSRLQSTLSSLSATLTQKQGEGDQKWGCSRYMSVVDEWREVAGYGGKSRELLLLREGGAAPREKARAQAICQPGAKFPLDGD